MKRRRLKKRYGHTGRKKKHVVKALHPERCTCGTSTSRHADSCPAMFGTRGDCEVCGSLNPSSCGHYDAHGNLIDEDA